MTALWRSPALALGVVLFVLGVGNWLVSRNKILEYSHRVDTDTSSQRIGNLEVYPHLSPRTNATLLMRLHRGLVDYSFTNAKLDFYQVVDSGGRMLALVGLLLIGGSVARNWVGRRTRSAPAAGA